MGHGGWSIHPISRENRKIRLSDFPYLVASYGLWLYKPAQSFGEHEIIWYIIATRMSTSCQVSGLSCGLKKKKRYDEVGAASGECFWLGESINFFLSSTWTTGRRVVGMNFPQNWRISEAPTSWEMLNVEPRGGDSQSPAKTQFFFGVLLINGSGLKMCASQVVFKTVCFKTSPGRLMLISILCLYCWQLCWTRSALVTLTSQWTTIFYLIWGTLPNRRDHSCNWTFLEIS